MTAIPLLTLVAIIIAAAGIVWAYPKLPSPWNVALVAIVALVCLVALLNLTGLVVIR